MQQKYISINLRTCAWKLRLGITYIEQKYIEKSVYYNFLVWKSVKKWLNARMYRIFYNKIRHIQKALTLILNMCQPSIFFFISGILTCRKGIIRHFDLESHRWNCMKQIFNLYIYHFLKIFLVSLFLKIFTFKKSKYFLVLARLFKRLPNKGWQARFFWVAE